jgi:methionyl-tRNA synthetase
VTNRPRYYITTPIYYVNGVPHVGSATTTLLVDALARYRRQQGDHVFFVTGVDEHAPKVAEAAAKNGVTPQAFVDEISQRYVETWRLVEISNDDFIRTSEERHKKAVAETFRRLQSTGDIYPGKYEGWYSVADETFFRDSEVENGFAKESGAAVQRVTEDVYFFRLSAYGDKLLAAIESQPDLLMPDTRRNEVIAYIKEGLRDMAVTRRNAGWGIPVPGDPSQVVYVWFDALINYLTVTGWPDKPGWDAWWPAQAHFVGKEIYTRFHATLWPAMLMALGLPLPHHVVGHGWWLIKGEKGSKSKGNIPTPEQVTAEIAARSGCRLEAAVDALRYYLIHDISFTGDAEFSQEELARRYNADLCNDLGNLLNRTLKMLVQYQAGVIVGGSAATASGTLAGIARATAAEATALLDGLDPPAALAAIWKVVSAGNKEIDTAAPWRLHKEGSAQGVTDALYTAVEALRISSTLLAPFLPYTAAEIRRQLGLDPAPAAWSTAFEWGLTPAGTRIGQPEPIFPRIVKAAMTQQPEPTPAPVAAQPAPPAPAAAASPAAELIDIADFAKVQLRVAEIKTAERVEGANKLLRLTVDAGEGADRQLVAGIAESYDVADLPGRKIVIVANLKPAVIRGVESNGMLLAATDADGKAILLTPERAHVAAGSKIK